MYLLVFPKVSDIWKFPLCTFKHKRFSVSFPFLLGNPCSLTQIWVGCPLGLLPSCHPGYCLHFSVLYPQDTNDFIWGIICLEPFKEKLLGCFVCLEFDNLDKERIARWKIIFPQNLKSFVQKQSIKNFEAGRSSQGLWKWYSRQQPQHGLLGLREESEKWNTSFFLFTGFSVNVYFCFFVSVLFGEI